MNERIKELACKTLTRFDQDMDGSMEPEKLGDWIRYNDLEKFAELIIQECAKVADNNFNKGFCPVGDYIKQHFDILETNNE